MNWKYYRELDTLVAEHVMGLVACGYWAQYNAGRGNVDFVRTRRCPHAEGACCPHRRLPFYSSDIAAAWQVVEHYRKANWSVAVSSPHSGGDWWVYMHEYRTDAPCYDVNASTAPHAICLAALKAKGVEVPSER